MLSFISSIIFKWNQDRVRERCRSSCNATLIFSIHPTSPRRVQSHIRRQRYTRSCGSCDRYLNFFILTRSSCFLISHAHLDHVNSLVISAGSLSGPRKRLYAAKQTLTDLESVFSDRIWPNLASWNEDDDDHKLLYTMCVAQSSCSRSLLNSSLALA